MRQTGYFAQTTDVDKALLLPTFFTQGSVQDLDIQVSWKSSEGSRSCGGGGGSKITISYWLGPWLIQHSQVYYVSSLEFLESLKVYIFLETV